jgi:hypoxanthine phosphoribosyltransferase
VSQPGPTRPAEARVVLDVAALERTIARLAREIERHHDDETVMICTLTGGLIFASDLVRTLRIRPRLDFVAVSSFQPGTRARLLYAPDLDLSGSPVVLVTDVIDTAMSLQFVLDELQRGHPASVTVCALVDKPHRRLVPLEVDHVGVTVDDDFLIGYGLDFAGRYRNVPVLAAADVDLLAADPGCYLDWAYGNRPRGSEDTITSG